MRMFGLLLALGGATWSWAGHYEVTMSGGGPFHITGSSGLEWTTPYEGTGSWRGGSALSADPPENGQNPVPGPGSVTAMGEITATFTWTPDSVGDHELPPSVVIIKQHSLAFWTGGQGQVQNGFGDGTSSGPYYGSSDGTYYEVVPKPDAIFSRTCAPSAHADYLAQSGAECCTVGVVYEAAAYPVRITYAGVLDATDQSKQSLLIGQKLRATLDLGGLATSGQNTFTWNIAGGQPFTAYVPGPFSNGDDNTETVYTPWAQTIHQTENATDNVTTAFAGKDDGAVVSCRVVTLSPALDITVSKKVKIDHPVLSRMEVPVVGTMQLTPDSQSPTKFELLLTGGVTGMTFHFWVTTPEEYHQGSDVGKFAGVQLVDDTGTEVLVGSEQPFYLSPYPDELCLDGSYPYASTQAAWCPAGRIPAGVQLRFIDDKPWDSVIVVQTISESLDFIDYVMYEPPDNGLGILDVPARYAKWHVARTATRGTPWVLGPDGSGPSETVVDFPSHPRWKHVIGG